MDNKIDTIDTLDEGTEKKTQDNVVEGNNNQSVDETLTMSKTDFDKAIQAAEDRVRTKYTKNIKALEDKIAELTPVEKSEAELEFEKRLAELERKEKESDAKAKAISLKTALQEHNIDANIADYLNPDIDINAFSADVEKLISTRLTADGYKPLGHQASQPISKADYENMTYDEKAELYSRDPELWKRLKN